MNYVELQNAWTHLCLVHRNECLRSGEMPKGLEHRERMLDAMRDYQVAWRDKVLLANDRAAPTD